MYIPHLQEFTVVVCLLMSTLMFPNSFCYTVVNSFGAGLVSHFTSLFLRKIELNTRMVAKW